MEEVIVNEEGSTMQKSHKSVEHGVSMAQFHMQAVGLFIVWQHIKFNQDRQLKQREHLIMIWWPSLPSPPQSDHCS